MDIIKNLINTGLSYLMAPRTMPSGSEYTNLATKVTTRINKRGCYYLCRNNDISLFGLIIVCIFGVLVFSFILYLFIILIIGCCRNRKNKIDIEVDECESIETEYEPPTGEQTAGNQIDQQKYMPPQGYYYPPPPQSFFPHGAKFRRGQVPPNGYYVPYYYAHGHPHPRHMGPHSNPNKPSKYDEQQASGPYGDNSKISKDCATINELLKEVNRLNSNNSKISKDCATINELVKEMNQLNSSKISKDCATINELVKEMNQLKQNSNNTHSPTEEIENKKTENTPNTEPITEN